MLIDGGEAQFLGCHFIDNRAPEGGSALFVRATIGAGVRLERGTLLMGNTVPSITTVGGRIEYKLPAPKGRWIYAPVDTQNLADGITGNFPYACAPGVSGAKDSDTGGHGAQNGPQCLRLWSATAHQIGSPMLTPRASHARLQLRQSAK